MSIPPSPSSTRHSPFTSIQFEDINFYDILNQDMAIRQFCPERMDQEPEWNDNLFDIETWSSSLDSSSPPCSVTMDEDSSSFIDSVINSSLCEEVAESYVDDITMRPVLMDNTDPDLASINKGLELVHLLLACGGSWLPGHGPCRFNTRPNLATGKPKWGFITESFILLRNGIKF